MKHKKTTLRNGLRIITVPTKDSPAVTVLIIVETGSNYEDKEQNGLSHFLEHMVFKGTKRYSTPLDVALEFDRIGAENNAFTTAECTGYYAKAGNKHWKKLVEMISEMYLHPTLPESELEKERGVILQEISMKEDLPQRKVQDVFNKLVFGDTPYGRTIIGPAENVKRLKREEFTAYRERHYVPERTIVVVAGDVPEASVISEVKKYFKPLARGKRPAKARLKLSQKAPALAVLPKKTDQMHLVLGFPTFGATDKRSTALSIITSILSSGMSSRLFKKLREDMGACYYVNASSNLWADYGDLTISTGIDKRRLEEVLNVLLSEVKKLATDPVPESELNKTKEYMVSHLYMALETTDALSEFYGFEEVTRRESFPPDHIEKQIRKVTAKDIQKVAKQVFRNDRLNLAVVGDIKSTARLKKLLML